MGNPVASAFIAAILAGVIIAPVFGLQIIRAGATTQLQPDWGMILMGMGLVFVVQLFKPALAKVFKRTSQARPVAMPAMSGMTAPA